jgi:hypothetical protein
VPRLLGVDSAKGNGMSDFAAAWALYPRKVGKKDAERAWNRLTESQRFEVIHALPIHVRYWDAVGTDKQYMPHFSSWLNGERWTDELEMPAKKSDADWWRSTAGIEAKAREVGMWPPRAGEDWMSLKARIMAKVAA